MRIECKTTFLHDTERFAAGDVRTVPDELGEHFCRLGWATAQGVATLKEPGPADVALSIDSAKHGQVARHG